MKKTIVSMATLLTVLVIHPSLFAGTIRGHVSVKKTEYLKEVVVYVRKAEGVFQPRPESPVPVMDQQNLAFIPKVLPILVGTTVTFKNTDTVKHNVFSPDGEQYDIGTWGPGVSTPHTFSKPGIYTQLCNIHHEMEAFIVVLQNPYFAQVASDGTYEIRGVPPGEYELKAWHNQLTPKSQNITVGAGATTADFEL